MTRVETSKNTVVRELREKIGANNNERNNTKKCCYWKMTNNKEKDYYNKAQGKKKAETLPLKK